MNKRKLRATYRKYLFSYTFEAIEAYRTMEALEQLQGDKSQ